MKIITEQNNMIPRLLKDLGMRFPTETSKRKYRFGLYECQYCKKEFEADIQNINRKGSRTKSCGCILGVKHKLSSHRLYKTWYNMINRCTNTNSKDYPYYGGRGISVCDRWLSIENFIEDMYPSFTEGLSIDRISIDGNYEPNNCRWADKTTQSCNTKKLRRDNSSGFRGVHVNGDRYIAKIGVYHKEIFLGTFSIPEQGALAYDTYVRKHNLEHTKNFYDEEYYKLLEKYKNG